MSARRRREAIGRDRAAANPAESWDWTRPREAL